MWVLKINDLTYKPINLLHKNTFLIRHYRIKQACVSRKKVLQHMTASQHLDAVFNDLTLKHRRRSQVHLS